MPGEKHYFDAPNAADFLEKFVQHHADPAKDTSANMKQIE